METIEERAKEYATQKADISLSDIYNEALANIYEEAYIAGATEQKAIDDAESPKSSQGNCGTMLEKLREYLSTSSQEDLNAKYNELSEFLSTEHVTTAYDEANYQQGYHDAVERACKWFTDYLMEMGYPDDWMRDSPNMESGEERFIKVMEEYMNYA